MLPLLFIATKEMHKENIGGDMQSCGEPFVVDGVNVSVHSKDRTEEDDYSIWFRLSPADDEENTIDASFLNMIVSESDWKAMRAFIDSRIAMLKKAAEGGAE